MLDKTSMEITRQIFDILQSITIVVTTIFTGWWTYKTFAHKEKIADLRNILVTIEEIKFEIRTLGAIPELIELVQSREKFLDLSIALDQSVKSSLYIATKDRNTLSDFAENIMATYRNVILEKDKTKKEFDIRRCADLCKEMNGNIVQIAKKYT